ncbi:MAG: TetR family transcriptional regulator [Pseudonocardiaceae bacterium]|nr:TetR family transcriptional regulator [Pseudonocardiaceae bacterium]
MVSGGSATAVQRPAARARQARAVRAEQSILAAALAAFHELGFHGASMRDIAARADVGLASLYNYVDSKQDLLVAVLRRASADQLADTRQALQQARPTIADRLGAAVAAHVRFDVERQAECFVANSELRYLDARRRADLVAARDRQERLFEQLVAEGIREGAFRTPHPGEAARAILTMCAGVTIWYRPDGPLSVGGIAQRYARYALALLEGV